MNILHMKYAVEVAKAGSINKASEVLFIAQPNLSRSIKELEADLGIAIFDRSAKGMFLTPEGEEFIARAKKILEDIEDVENMYRGGAVKRKFSVSVPRASYMSDALASFAKGIGESDVEIFYKETNSSKTIKNVLSGDYKLGIIRYAQNYDKYFRAMLEEKELAYEMIAEFRYLVVMNRESPLAGLDEIRFGDLEPYIEIAHADPYVPSLPVAVVRKEELPENVGRRIFVYERASQFDLLSENRDVFMWVSPMPEKLLKRYDLVQRESPDNIKIYKDVLIYHKEYKLTELDELFISEVFKSSRHNL
ncbi:MAG: LysR family transcriptional regulator [Oscillospiraceae bacterium]|nr:LysR family transcriptional regulator [Oscillospiraceae bacterium]